MRRVFVYGTLKRGHRNHGLLQSAVFCGTACAAGYLLYDLGSYPGVVPTDDPAASVPGELYDVDDVTLGQLDQLEDEGRLYARESIPMNGHPVFIYVYLGSLDAAEQIDEWVI